MAYPKELTELLEEYLVDGSLSEGELRVLAKKSQAAGVDPDEFVLYAQAQQQKLQQQLEQQKNAAEAKLKGAQCPYCHAPIQALMDVCPECGSPLNPQFDGKLKELLDNLEDALVDYKSGYSVERTGAKVERYIREAKTRFGRNSRVQNLLAEVEREKVVAEKRAKKEAVYEVLSKYKWAIMIVLIAVILIISEALAMDHDGEYYGFTVAFTIFYAIFGLIATCFVANRD